MSIKQLANLPAANKGYQPWTRPSDWLALPTVNVGDQKVVALAAVFANGPNIFAVQVNGAYTVDWGDGTVENVAAGTQRNHTYSYAGLPANNTTEGWKQVIVTITPQSGQTLTSVTMNVTPTGTSAGYVQQWRDIKMAGNSVSTLIMNDHNGMRNAFYQFEYVGPSAMTNLTDHLRAASNLRVVLGTQWTSLVTDMTSMFSQCGALESVPLFDTGSCTKMDSMFANCARLRTVPLFNTASVTSMISMFQTCYNLTSVPLFNTANVISMNNMFTSCISLSTIPLFVTTKVTNMAGMFNGCSTFQSLPALDTGNVTTMNGMFQNCVSLTTLASSYNTAKVTDFSNTFNGCSLLPAHPTMSAAACTTMANMFASCTLLSTVSFSTSSLVTTFAGMLTGCPSVTSITLNMAAASSQANANLWTAGAQFLGLTTLVLTGLRFAPSSTWIQNNQLSGSALDALYTSLGTASGAQTISVSGNPGTTSDTPSIATAKGWTITGT